MPDGAAHPQHAHAPQGTVPAARPRPGRHVRLRHDRVRLLPPRARPDAPRVRRGGAVPSPSRVPADIRPQHHGHRRQDHRAGERERRTLRGGDGAVHRRDARGLRGARDPAPGPGAPGHRIRRRHARPHRGPRGQGLCLPRRRGRRLLSCRPLSGVREALGEPGGGAPRRGPGRGGREQGIGGGLRAVEGGEAGRALLALALGPGPAGAGTSSAPRCRWRTSARSSTSTAGAPTSCFPTTSARSPSPRRAPAGVLQGSGCTTRSCASTATRCPSRSATSSPSGTSSPGTPGRRSATTC